MSDEKILNQIEKKTHEYMEKKHYSCAMASMLALQEQFKLGDAATVKATSFLPGIAGRGQTCGAVLGSLLALGIACAPDELENMDERREVQEKTASILCDWFVNEYTGLTCQEVQKKLAGRSFNMRDPEDRKKFRESAAGEGCRNVAARAARIAAEIILESQK